MTDVRTGDTGATLATVQDTELKYVFKFSNKHKTFVWGINL